MIDKLWNRIPKWLILCVILILVSLTTILQTYSSFDTNISTVDSKHNATLLQNLAGTQRLITTTEVVLLHETVPMHDFVDMNRTRVNDKKSDSINNSVTSIKNDDITKIKHIGFLKVHKAGSCTMQNIFFRFGLKYNLTFVLPKKGHYFLSTQSAMWIKPGNHRDILACHSVYSRKLFGSVLPTDSINIGIIRKPLERMISAAYYYRYVWKTSQLMKVPRANFIHNLINRPDLYEPQPFSKTKNAMGRDFGFSDSIKINDTLTIKKHLDLVKQDFKLVPVMERFDESLILMKRTLNWGLSDILYIKLNSHDHKPPVMVNSTELKTFQTTCFLDFIIYDTFYEIFDKNVAAKGNEFQKEVEHFQSVLDKVKEFCNQQHNKQNRSKTSLNIMKSKWNEPFELFTFDCLLMERKSLKFVALLKERHGLMNKGHSNK